MKNIIISGIIVFFITHASITAASDIYKCSDPKGTTMWSMENHKQHNDGFKGVNPVIVIGNEIMTITWGDSKSAGGAEKSWKAIIVHRDNDTVSGVALDAEEGNSAVMLYTLDKKRGYIYMSAHKNSRLLNGTSAASFVGSCKKF